MILTLTKQVRTLAVAVVAAVAMAGCAPADSGAGSSAPPAASPASPLTEVSATLPTGVDNKCVQVFFDRSSDPTFMLGRDYATMTLNLLAHFPDYPRIVSPIELYRAGDLDRCTANIYIGAYYDNTLPVDFLNDFVTTRSRVMWLGFNVWELGTQFDRIFGYHFDDLTFADMSQFDANGNPGYYRDVIYRGETFSKLAKWDSSHTLFDGAVTQAQLTPVDPSRSTVLAVTRHSVSFSQIPWAIRTQNRFYVADAPFDYLHEGDRYLVFADLLFDLLQEAPRHSDHPAIVRLEDLHPFVDLNLLDQAMTILRSHGVPANLSVIPIYSDPFGANSNVAVTQGHVPMSTRPLFASALQSYAAAGASVLWHGVTHQVDAFQNPFTGTSGDDYEFWDANRNAPLTFDSATYVSDRLKLGENEFKALGLDPKIWITPHYKASAVDCGVFAKTFNWSLGRQWYSSAINSGVGQIFPYEVFGDVFGQAVLPENLGNVQVTTTAQVQTIRTAQEILADARRNLVLRDSWGSFFFHPFLLQNSNDLEPIITGMQQMGYRFVNLNSEYGSAPSVISTPAIDLEKIR